MAASRTPILPKGPASRWPATLALGKNIKKIVIDFVVLARDTAGTLLCLGLATNMYV